MFDEEPEGDPHGECAKEIHDLQAEVKRLMILNQKAFDQRDALELQIRELSEEQKNAARWVRERDAAELQVKQLERLNGEMLALMKKIDAFFESPKIIPLRDTLVLDIPYEIAAGVKAVVTDTSLKEKDKDLLDRFPGGGLPFGDMV